MIRSTHGETNLPQLLNIEDETAVKDERGLGHLLVHDLPVDLLELLPLGRDHDGLLLLARLECAVDNSHVLLDILKRRRWAGLLQVLPDLRLLDLGVVDGHIGALSEEVADERDGRGFTSIASVSLECKPKDGDVLYNTDDQYSYIIQITR